MKIYKWQTERNGVATVIVCPVTRHDAKLTVLVLQKKKDDSPRLTKRILKLAEWPYLTPVDQGKAQARKSAATLRLIARRPGTKREVRELLATALAQEET
jgi:hypothetical protein